MAKKLPAGEGNILEQGNKYEGYVVWFQQPRRLGGRQRSSTPKAADAGPVGRQGGPDHRGRRDLRPRRPVALDHRRRTRRGCASGGPAGARSCSTGHTSTRPPAPPPRRASGRQEGVREHGLCAAGPASTGASRAKVSIGGANIGISATEGPSAGHRRPRSVHDGPPSGRRYEAINEGLPPVSERAVRRPRWRSARSTRSPTMLREQLKDAVVRPATRPTRT